MTSLYEDLGVERDASAAAIAAAYKRRAKRAHPDAGGDPEEFRKVSRAAMVLRDPARRRKYDEDGAVDDAPDNVRAAAIQVIEAFIGAAIREFVDSKLKPEMDPRRRDLLVEFDRKMRGEIAEALAAIENGRHHLEFLRDLASRFRGHDTGAPIQRLFETRIRAVELEVETIRKSIAARECARGIASMYDFDAIRDDPLASGFSFTVTVR